MLHDRSDGVAKPPADRGASSMPDDLPPRYNRRWTVQQQRQVLAAIDSRALTAAEAILRYGLGAGDLPRWRKDASCAPADTTTDAPLRSADTSSDRVSRLIELLLRRGLIDEFDAASIEQPRADGLARLFSQFIVDDRPIV